MSEHLTRLDVYAPLSGVLVPLSDVPDPVFAERMVGDGVSLDPTSSELLAPVAGIVTHLHNAHHALTITTDDGIEVLVHIGIDTVMLRGEGFAPRIRQGERVTMGQPLIGFAADFVATRARSLLTQVLIANGGEEIHVAPFSGPVQAGRDVVMRIEHRPVTTELTMHSDHASATLFSEPVTLPNPQGLHARPAAVLAAAAKKFRADVRLLRGKDEANAKSVVSVMVLSTQAGDSIRVQASGADAAQAVRELAALLAAGCGEGAGESQAAASAPLTRPVTAPTAATGVASANPDIFPGVAASPGLAVGKVVQVRAQRIEVSEAGVGVVRERAHLDTALREAVRDVELLKREIADASKAKILDAHQELLADPELVDLAVENIANGKSAGWAWRAAFTLYAGELEGLDNALLRERANDVRDVGRRVLLLLAGVTHAKIDVPTGSILIAEELTPSDTATLDRSKVLGFCTVGGGATGHVAILARSFGIPAICGMDSAALKISDGTEVVIDGSAGTLRRNPDAAALSEAHARMTRHAARVEQEKAAAGAPAITRDGARIEVVANVRDAAETREAVAIGGEGVGLLRSEFLFSDRDTAPSEDEQAAAYRAVAEVLGRERPLVIRTLDIGGDKPLSYLPMPREDNPFLGLRGIRVSLDYPDMFRTQLRAMLKAAPVGNLHIMFPMIATLDELRAAKKILNEEQRNTGHTAKVGIMIEVPSAALIAERLAPEVDFFSIGTNDLTQYTLAMDRGHARLAREADGLHPSVLRLIGMTVDAAHQHDKWVGVCGGIAGDAMAVPVLIGLGVDELSVSVPAIPAVKALVCRLTRSECQSLAQEVLQMGTATEVRARLASFAD
ncbi:MAG: phosphoenolpyruvate--protein phosphotransferase [Betaproteobacteria bacterium]|nr:phosphoenolpyruvate--protein phosphotransferase [Betaproteobacteria bacterium]